MKTKQEYGNHQQVSEAMLAGLEVLQAMCGKYNLWLAVYVEQHSPSMPIVLAIYDGNFAVSQSNLYNEEEFLEWINVQLEYVDFKYKHNKSYKHN